MTDPQKAMDLLLQFLEEVTGHSWHVDKESKNEEDHQNNHRKICTTTGLECIACVPGSPCATEDDQLKNDTREWVGEPMPCPNRQRRNRCESTDL